MSDSAGEPDELRSQVEHLVDAFVAQVLQGMRSNISINGLDVVARGRSGGDGEAFSETGEMEGVMLAGENGGVTAVEQEDFEPFDAKLRSQLAATVARRDALISKISAHRRATPGSAAAAWQRQFERESEVLAEGERDLARRVGEVGEGDVVTVQALQRADELQRNWERAVEGLAKLNQGLPETRARLERCGDVVGYVGGAVRK